MITILGPAPTERLERDLRAVLRGEVHFDEAYRAMYSTDAANYRQLPVCVILPLDANDAQAAMQICHRYGTPVTPRGGGTCLTGSSCNVGAIFDYSKHMHHILELDPERKIVRVEPGVVLDDVRSQAEKYGLTVGPAPATHNRCAVGGMFGNNSCGMPAQFAGRMEENVLEAEVLLHDGTRLRVGSTRPHELEAIVKAGGRRGEIYAKLSSIAQRYGSLVRERYPQIPRRVSGYPLNQLLPENGFNVARALVGTEGTVVHVLEITIRLVPNPKKTALTIAGFDDIAIAGDHVAHCNRHIPHALEGMDETLFTNMQEKGFNPSRQEELFPRGHGWLVVQFGGDTTAEATRKAEALAADLRKRSDVLREARVVSDQQTMQHIVKIRESSLGVTSKVPNHGDFYPGWEDSAVAPEHLGKYLREFQKKMNEYGYTAALYGHFGQGCVHCSIDFDLFTQEGIEKYRRFVTEMAHIVVKYGGSLSGEHGDGQSRGELLPIMFGAELMQAFWEFKSAFDPHDKMNPGKVVKPLPLDRDLRWGTQYDPWDPPTKFHFQKDRGSFAYAANRCVGAGVCRKHDEGTMCPSYMVSKEERYATRGRARLLFEMLRGDPMKRGWKNEAVKESLDYCLACKGCKHECPVNVDMATYKAEFLYHYYQGKLRPLHAWLFGYMFLWAKMGSLAPNVVNFFSQAAPFSTALKKLASIAPERHVPLFADQTFRQWWKRRPLRNSNGTRVLLWIDTWNNHFHPQTAKAAVEVLEDAGYRVLIPPQQICCGRPLYDYGMLDRAQRQLRAILDDLRPLIRAGVPLVGLEPSCLSVFKDEMVELLGHDLDAMRLAQQCFDFETFLQNKASHYQPPSLERRAVVHRHCHHKAVLDPQAEGHVFEDMHVAQQRLDSGCCGMAGAFGFEQSHYEMSVACGERVLLPKVRDASPQTLIVADGFSCREQISQCTDRQALHPVEVLRMALADRGYCRDDALPERRFAASPRERRSRILRNGYAILAAVAVVATVAAGTALRRLR